MVWFFMNYGTAFGVYKLSVKIMMVKIYNLVL